MVLLPGSGGVEKAEADRRLDQRSRYKQAQGTKHEQELARTLMTVR